jgi:hypothetical protein
MHPNSNGPADGVPLTLEEARRYCEEVRALREENRQLRESASAFGRLAERLNIQLQEERRRTCGDCLQTSLVATVEAD